jgi:hypothetical protein
MTPGKWDNTVDLGCIFCRLSTEVFPTPEKLLKHLRAFHNDSDFKNDCDMSAM